MVPVIIGNTQVNSVSEFLGIYITTLNYGIFKFYQTLLIQKSLETTGMDHINRLKTSVKDESTLGKYENIPQDKIDWTHLYAYIIGIMLYLVSSTKPDISFAVN